MDFGTILDVLSWACILVGGAVAIIGAIGMLRLPDVFSRMHGAGMIDTMGMGLVLVGLMFQTDEWIIIVKLILIIAFILLTAPTTTFALARAALDAGVDPGPRDKLRAPPRDELRAPPRDKLPGAQGNDTDASADDGESRP